MSIARRLSRPQVPLGPYALSVKKNASPSRRARACPSPCLDLHEKWPGSAFGFRVGRALAGDRPPRYGLGRGSPQGPLGP